MMLLRTLLLLMLQLTLQLLQLMLLLLLLMAATVAAVVNPAHWEVQVVPKTAGGGNYQHHQHFRLRQHCLHH